MLSDVEAKIDNLDARNLRQLNQLYGEIKKLEGMCVHLSVCVCVCAFFLHVCVHVHVCICVCDYRSSSVRLRWLDCVKHAQNMCSYVSHRSIYFASMKSNTL